MDKQQNLSDYRYIEALLQNRQAEVEEIYTTFLPRIKKLVRQNSGTEDDALDVFQEGLVVVYKKAQQADFQLTSSFYSFLYGICRFIWLKKLDKKPALEVTFDEIPALSSESDIEHLLFQAEQEQLYREKFAQLSEKCQAILELYAERVKMIDIAKKLGYASDNAAKKAKFKCKEKLVALVQGDARFKELL